jgi:hypothetical protein
MNKVSNNSSVTELDLMNKTNSLRNSKGRLSHETGNNLKELFRIHIDVGTSVEPMVIYQGMSESPEELAHKFCKKYNYNKEAQQSLV